MKLIPIDQLPDTSRLTSRELEIYDLVGYGMTRHSIAMGLGISVNTLKNHLEAIKVKLGVEHVSDVIRAAVCVAIHTGQPEEASFFAAMPSHPQRSFAQALTATLSPQDQPAPTACPLPWNLRWRPAPFLSILLAPWAA